MADRPGGSIDRLGHHIDELESLIAGGKEAHPATGEIPVLDEVVEPGTAVPAAPDAAATPDMAALEERLLRRLDAELSDFMGVVQEVVRRCVQEELKAAAGTDPRTPPHHD